jgi:FixJ family two-component response regulator
VLIAPTPAAAIALAAHYPERIHLVVTDLIMPGMSGQQLVRDLKRSRPDIRVVYMSGYTDAAISQHGKLEGGAAFVEKPVLPEVLLLTVRQVLDAR